MRSTLQLSLFMSVCAVLGLVASGVTGNGCLVRGPDQDACDVIGVADSVNGCQTDFFVDGQCPRTSNSSSGKKTDTPVTATCQYQFKTRIPGTSGCTPLGMITTLSTDNCRAPAGDACNSAGAGGGGGGGAGCDGDGGPSPTPGLGEGDCPGDSA